MTMTTLNPDTLIAPEYIDAHGKPRRIPAATAQWLHSVIQPPVATPSALPPVAIFHHGEAAVLQPVLSTAATWELTSEAGERWSGECQPDETLTLPALPEGYHQLTLTQPVLLSRCSLIIAPSRCYEPPALLAGDKLWGCCVQLYTVRSQHNWGIGDFGDLRRMAAEIAQRGGAFIGLNPLHALFPANPDGASPYSPSSRRWLNVLYIDINSVEDFRLGDAAQAWWQQPDTQQRLAAARDSEWVDYPAVTALKLEGLRLAWRQFRRRAPDEPVMQEFDAFVKAGGQSLLSQALFDALQAHQRAKNPALFGWKSWPEAYQHPDSAAVLAFRIEHSDEVRFYLWLQWLAASQFAACWAVCCAQQMPVGLYRDLAVGVAQDGAETWRERDLYCLQASVGAPPDILGPLGQNWGLPPMDPQILTMRAFTPWIELLRANMRDCGALRIDHVMALLRLWWIPQYESAAEGAYVHYPVDALLAILALESQRHRCMVIGEDLGTVPEAIVAKLRDSGVYSYKVLYFEQTGKRAFRMPEAWPRQAMAVVTTHDMPTLRGWWQSDDLTLGSKLGLYPDKAILAGLYRERAAAKKALLHTLQQQGALAHRYPRQRGRAPMRRAINRAVHRLVAASNSALLGLQPEEWLDMEQPVNVPGTVDSYPNWRRKLRLSLEAMFADEGITHLLQEVSRIRQQRP